MNARNAEGASPLSRAARWGHVDCVIALLRSGADPDLADSEGLAPRDWARRKGHATVEQALAEWEGAEHRRRAEWSRLE